MAQPGLPPTADSLPHLPRFARLSSRFSSRRSSHCFAVGPRPSSSTVSSRGHALKRRHRPRKRSRDALLVAVIACHAHHTACHRGSFGTSCRNRDVSSSAYAISMDLRASRSGGSTDVVLCCSLSIMQRNKLHPPSKRVPQVCGCAVDDSGRLIAALRVPQLQDTACFSIELSIEERSPGRTGPYAAARHRASASSAFSPNSSEGASQDVLAPNLSRVANEPSCCIVLYIGPGLA